MPPEWERRHARRHEPCRQHPPLTALCSDAGSAAALTGYLIALSASRLIPHGPAYERARGWICGYGFWCIAFFACVPNPFFDAIELAAGALKYSWWFALSCFLRKAVKFLIAALVGLEALRHGWLH